MKIILNPLFLMILLISNGCSKSHSTKPQGGQDSGGGDVNVSAIEDVEYNYKRAIKDAADLYTAFFYDISFASAEKKLLQKAVLNRLGIEVKRNFVEIKELEDVPFAKREKILFSDLLQSSKINIQKNDLCRSREKHGAASIKELKYKSDICISFLALKNVPKESLYREILALLLHEYTHALGFNEVDAQKIQQMFAEAFDLIENARFDGSSGHSILNSLDEAIEEYVLFIAARKPGETLNSRRRAVLCSHLTKLATLGNSIEERVDGLMVMHSHRLIKLGILSETEYKKRFDYDSMEKQTLYAAESAREEYCREDAKTTYSGSAFDDDQPMKVKSVTPSLEILHYNDKMRLHLAAVRNEAIKFLTEAQASYTMLYQIY